MGVSQISWLDERLRDAELKLSEHLGRCGDGGTFQRVEDDVKQLKHDVEVLNGFRSKVLIYASVGVAVGGFLAALVSHLIGKMIG